MRADWRNVYFGAVPYLEAMEEMDDVRKPYYLDSGTSIVRYFLANANTWRGDVGAAGLRPN